MERVEIHLMKKDVEKALKALHPAMVIEAVSILGSQGAQGHDIELSAVKSRTDRLLDFAEEHRIRPRGLIRSMLPEEGPILDIPDREVVGFVSGRLRIIESFIDPIRKRIQDIEDDLSFLSDALYRLTQISGLDIDLDSLSRFRFLKVRIGYTRRFSELRVGVEGAGGSVEGSILDRREGLHAVSVIYSRKCAPVVDEVLRGRLFTEIVIDRNRLSRVIASGGVSHQVTKSPVKDLLPQIEMVHSSLLGKKDAALKEASDLCSKHYFEIKALSEALDVEKDLERARGLFSHSRYAASISGWVPRRRSGELISLLKASIGMDFQADIRDPTQEEIGSDSVPVQLRNGWLGRLFEPMTKTFAIPRYNEIDPSLFISIPFILFFGMMMGDAGYGALIIILSIFLYFTGKRSQMLKNVSILGMFLGASSILAGIWMGAFFGDLVPRLFLEDPSRPLYSLTIAGYSLPYDSLRDPMHLFGISMLLGLLHMNLGFVLLGYDRLRKKDIWGLLKSAGSWALIQSGAGILLGGTMLNVFDAGTPLLAAGGVLFLTGAILLAFEMKIMTFFAIEGIVGDIVSYTRILALGLSTFGLAMAFNIVGEMVGGIMPVLIPVSALMLALLHMVNLPLQMLGGFVHSLRLQYVEFFGKFYEGGGREFEPFGRERLHTRPGRDLPLRGGGDL